MSLLSANTLSIGYRIGSGNRTIARNISFDVAAGEALAILGPNGAGKTTLFRTLLGLIAPIAGHVTAAGKPLTTMAPPDIARTIGYVPQSTQSLSHFNAMDVVTMARIPHLAWYAPPGQLDRDIAAVALERVGALRFASQSFATLSGGERQLVLLARALVADAKCLMLDEPTASLDFGNRIRVEDALNQLKHQGYAILFTTHEPSQANMLAGGSRDRTLTISRDGATTISVTSEATDIHRLAMLYDISIERLRESSAVLTTNI